MKQTKTAQVITENVELEFVDPQGEATSIDADLVFDPADPYAVTMVFRTGVQEVLWTFGRELLVEGLYEPTGDGDVHVWPCLSSNGSAVVIIELCSPDGELLVQAGSRNVTTLRQRDARRRCPTARRAPSSTSTTSSPSSSAPELEPQAGPHGSTSSASLVDHSSISSRVTGPAPPAPGRRSRCTPWTSRVVDIRKISSAESSTSIGSSTSTTSYHSRSRALVTPARQPDRQGRRAHLSPDDVADVGSRCPRTGGRPGSRRSPRSRRASPPRRARPRSRRTTWTSRPPALRARCAATAPGRPPSSSGRRLHRRRDHHHRRRGVSPPGAERRRPAGVGDPDADPAAALLAPSTSSTAARTARRGPGRAARGRPPSAPAARGGGSARTAARRRP